MRATGAVGIEATWAVAAGGAGDRVGARLAVRPSRGLSGLVLAESVSAVLRAGALPPALERLGCEAGAARG